MILRAGCYERVSSDEQAKFGFSIGTQIDALNEHCEKNNIKVVDHYIDDGVSGGKPAFKRPQMKRLLEDVEAGKIDIILFTRLDRWFRNVPEYFKVQEILDKHKVQWKAIWEDYDTTTANGEMAITIFLAIAQNERKKGSERVKAVFANKIKKKECIFSDKGTPFGYKRQKDENGIVRLVKDPATQDMVQDFWDVTVKYDSYNRGMAHCYSVYGYTRTERSWHKVAHNEIYTGTYKGVVDYCEPYVSREAWQRLQNRKIKKAQQNRIYLFTGLMRCPHCGERLISRYTQRHGKNGTVDYLTYTCRRQRVGVCKGWAKSELKIEKWLLDNIEKLLENEIASVEIAQTKPKKKPKNNIAVLREKLRKLNIVYMANNMSDDDYLKEQAELNKLIEQAEQEQNQEPVEKDTTALKELLSTDFKTIYHTLSKEDKRRFWRSIIKEIKLNDSGIESVDFFYQNSLF